MNRATPITPEIKTSALSFFNSTVSSSTTVSTSSVTTTSSLTSSTGVSSTTTTSSLTSSTGVSSTTGAFSAGADAATASPPAQDCKTSSTVFPEASALASADR